MTRMALAFTAGLATLAMAGSVAAADYPDPFGSGTALRSGYPSEWDNSDANDPLDFELGLRYWYSWGAQSFSIDPSTPALSVTDTTHSAEAYFRIDDNSTKFYAKGIGGASFMTNGSFSGLDTGSVVGGHIAYAGADLGYSMLGDGKGSPGFGPFAGYMYWNDSPNGSNTNLANSFTTATSVSDITYDPVTGQTFWPGDSTPNNIEMNMLRLGFSGKAQIGSMIDISGEVAAVPFAKMSGVLGSTSGAPLYYTDPPGTGTTTTQSTPGYNVASIQASPTNVNGWGYGAMVEAMVGFHPSDNLTFRLGGRLWYLQGKADATYDRAVIGNPSDSDTATGPNFDTAPTVFSKQTYITRDNPWSVFRYGVLAEMTYNF